MSKDLLSNRIFHCTDKIKKGEDSLFTLKDDYPDENQITIWTREFVLKVGKSYSITITSGDLHGITQE